MGLDCPDPELVLTPLMFRAQKGDFFFLAHHVYLYYDFVVGITHSVPEHSRYGI